MKLFWLVLLFPHIFATFLMAQTLMIWTENHLFRWWAFPTYITVAITLTVIFFGGLIKIFMLALPG